MPGQILAKANQISVMTKNKHLTAKPLTIIVGTYNRLPMLKQCITSLKKCKLIETIIVADAGSNDGTIEYLSNKTGISIMCDGKPIGQAKSFNRILPTVRTPYIGWISDDNVVRHNILDDAVKILDNSHDIGMLGLKVRDKTGAYAKHPYLGAVWASGILTVNQGVLRTNLLLQLGGFDEEFKDYGMDIDLTTRILLSGYKVAFTKHVAIHHYRDHETSNWIDKEGRTKRIKKAQELYKARYSELVAARGKTNFPLNAKTLEKLKWKMGSIGRDLRNIVMAKYISHFDLLKTLNKKYYLVQSIPTSILQSINCSAQTINHNEK